MTFEMTVHRGPRDPSLRRRLVTRAAIVLGHTLRPLPPALLAKVLGRVSRGARPASYAEAKASRDRVMSASLGMNALQACLQRSLAVALLCRMSGCWPTWCAGVRQSEPFTAHAWVEAEGRSVGEPGVSERFVALVRVSAG
ncbi:lasso peptide biosynthesis B2 protein [Micromonospora tarensis]|uniref:Lasso peptide biosynthesis B2 protein n=1 Tax=Micromonospora tarensis TaxID=2806100 RepID=A0ABS1YAL6_9ACTN|nr:lasso peptide biosynthesis B2 protein [Micromonospora tarensis]MBM0274451.1 lasso peptide biosynthesis B2 protein [Micromonospora tarensis]